jgi:hypothetical protein
VSKTIQQPDRGEHARCRASTDAGSTFRESTISVPSAQPAKSFEQEAA